MVLHVDGVPDEEPLVFKDGSTSFRGIFHQNDARFKRSRSLGTIMTDNEIDKWAVGFQVG